MAEKRIRVGTCHAVHRYAEANNKYMKNNDENQKSSYLMYLDASNLYGWGMSQKLLVNGHKWKRKKKTNIHRFNNEFIKNYNEDSDKILKIWIS